MQNNQIDLAQKQLLLEEAQRVPDLNFQVNYDRGGNIMRDFVGLGVSFDLPVFNKNKGNISAAKHKIDFEKVEKKALEKQIESETDFALKQVIFFEDLLRQKNDLNKNESDELLQNFYKHLQNKNITLLEFIDFTQAHLEAEKAYNEWVIEYFTNYEQLQYLVGKDF